MRLTNWLAYILKNGVALLKPRLNVAVFMLLKCVHITYTDLALTVKPHRCGLIPAQMWLRATPVWLNYARYEHNLERVILALSVPRPLARLRRMKN